MSFANWFINNFLGNLIADFVILVLVGLVTWLGSRVRAQEKALQATRGVPSISLDGQHVAYQDRGEIWASDGKQFKNLTHHPAKDEQPVWSNDGQSLAFVSYRDNDSEIYVVRIKSGKLIRVTTTLGLERPLGWDLEGNLKITSAGEILTITKEEIDFLGECR